MLHMVGGEHYLIMSAPKLLRFGIDSVLKIVNENMTQSINQSINDKGVCRTAPATLGLLNKFYVTGTNKCFTSSSTHLVC